MPRRVELLIPPVTAALVAVILAAGREPAQPEVDGPAVEKLSATDAKRVMRRVLARDRVARDVADGRRSVFAAAALFRALDQAAPPVAPPSTDEHAFTGEPLPVPFPHDTEELEYCRRVAWWTYLVLRPESRDRATAIVRKLADQVRAEVRAKGAITLADPAGLADEAERLIAEARWVPHGPAHNE